MRKSALDDIAIEVICRTCGTGHLRPVGFFRNHAQLICDVCGSEINVQNKELLGSVAEFGRAMPRVTNSH